MLALARPGCLFPAAIRLLLPGARVLTQGVHADDAAIILPLELVQGGGAWELLL